jgi:hypothetical protein
MNAASFTILISPEYRFTLRRESDGWEAEYPTMKQALDCAKDLVGDDSANLAVVDENGVLFMEATL